MLTALVVDDDAGCRHAVRAALEAAGWHVLVADGPVQARVLHDLHTPDLVVTDVWMADGDGLTMLAQLRADGRDTPALVVTSDPSAAVRERAVALDARAVLAKPVDAAALQRIAGGHVPRADQPDDGLDDELRAVLDALYARALPQRLGALRQAARAVDTAALAAAAHALAGASAQLGRLETAVLCRTVEREARAGRVDGTTLAQLTSR